MKTGLIVYIVGSDPWEVDMDCAAEVKKLGIDADMVEVISPTSGHFDIPDAWRDLTVRGMQRIECMIAEYTQAGGLKLQDRRLRLCG
jgi:hypothetical protein